MNDLVITFILVLIAFSCWAYLRARERRERAAASLLLDIQGKLDALLQHQGIAYDSLMFATGSVRKALDNQAVLGQVAAGNKIAAIKLYRQAYGGSLVDARDAIEELAARLEARKPQAIRVPEPL